MKVNRDQNEPFGFVAKVPLHPGRNLIPIQLGDDQGNKKTFYREIDYRVPENGVP